MVRVMLRTTVVGSWPPEERFRPALGRYFRGKLTDEAADAVLREVATIAIAQQRACGLTSYTGGETSADSFVLHFAQRLAGVQATPRVDAWGGRGSYRVVAEVSAPHSLGIAAAFRRERTIAPELSKVTVPGPSEVTTQLEPPAVRQASWPAAVELIRAEMRALIASGAGEIQLDLPQVAMGLADGGWETAQAIETIAAIFDGAPGVRRSVHLCYGDFGGRSWAQNRALHPLLPLLQQLDGVVDQVVLELSLPEQWAERHLLGELPPSLDLAAGIVDVKSPTIGTPSEIAHATEELVRLIPPERLLLSPSCGLGRRTVALAIAKVTAMVQAAHLINGEQTDAAAESLG